MRGFGLSIKDWGTGQASMREISRIAFTELKIDRAFVGGAAEEPLASALPAMLRFAKENGVSTVAEGIETQLDWERFIALGCDLARGYFITAPMDAPAHFAWSRRSRWEPERRVEEPA
jgi:EAL domain-containing protein (putative c-di-GMP-specific phosphodiesterase class I)